MSNLLRIYERIEEDILFSEEGMDCSNAIRDSKNGNIYIINKSNQSYFIGILKELGVEYLFLKDDNCFRII